MTTPRQPARPAPREPAPAGGPDDSRDDPQDDPRDDPPADAPDDTDDDAAAASAVDGAFDADARALASVLRLRILRLCLDEPRTNQEIAGRLGRDPATTYHHVRTLARRGFLAAQPVRRGARGAREVPYLATRKSWRMPRVPGQESLLIGAFLEEVAEAPPESVRTARLGLRLDDAGWAEFRERVDALLEEFATRPPDPTGTAYSVFVAYHEDAGRRPDEGTPAAAPGPVAPAGQ